MIKMLVPINDKIVVSETRPKFRIDFLSAAALTRRPPLRGDAAKEDLIIEAQEGW